MNGSVAGSSSGASVLATVEYHKPAEAVVITPLRRLRPGCSLSNPKGVHGTVMGLPTTLQADRSLYFAPAAADAQLVCTAHSPARAYLLWPAMQATPDWMHAGWTPVSGSEVKVRWAGFSLKQRAWLNITNQRRAYEEQPLLLYTLTSNSGVLPAGRQLQLPGFALYAGNSSEQNAPCGLVFPPALVLCRVRSNTSKHKSLAAASALMAADGFCDSFPGGCPLLEDAPDLDSCTLAELCLLLEEGMLDGSSLGQVAADALLHRAMSARDEELLLMLVQADVCQRCSQAALQLLLNYARMKDLLPLADHLLRCTTVEMTQPELDWLVGSLVASHNMFEAERLLVGYVLTRRNALSSTAAIEYALINAATASFVPNQDAMQLAKRFRAAKHTLLRQLIKRNSDEQKSSAWTATGAGNTTISTQGNDSLRSQLLHLADSSRCVKQGEAPSMLLDPLLHTVKLCLQEHSTNVIGRRCGVRRLSIHDTSPYSLALALQDSDFLGMQPVQDYTRLIWHGLELPRMRRVTWQTLASAEEAAAADGPFRHAQPASAGTTDSSPLPSFRVRAEPAERRPVRAYFSNAGEPVPEESASASHSGPVAVTPEGQQVSFDLNCGPGAGAHDGQPVSFERKASSRNESSSSGSIPSSKSAVTASSTTEWMIKSHRRLATHSSRKIAPGGNTAIRTAGVNGGAAAAADSSWMDTHVGYHLLQNLGLAGGFAARLALLGSILLHGVILAPRALHNSSWGRWVKRMVFEVLFVVVFQITVMAPWQDKDEWKSQQLLMFVMPPILLGNILDIYYQLKYKWDGNVLNYLTDHWSKLDVLVNFGLLGVVLWQYSCMIAGSRPDDAFNLEQYHIHLEAVVQSAFAVLVWARALGLLTPLSSKLGAMLYIVRRAAEEVGVLVPVVLVLMLGFGTTLTVTYSATDPKFNTLGKAMRVLIVPGDLRLMEFDNRSNLFMVVWGQAVSLLYIVIVNILIMSLVVAVITHAYNPESVKAHAIVMQAESTFQYDFHVRHALPCSPLNIVQQLFGWLPLGYRSRALRRACLKWWIIPLDGYIPAPIAAEPAMLVPTGPSEVGYLAFMFLMYPLFSIIGLSLLAAYMPFSVLYFTFKGHKVWLESTWSGDSNTPDTAAPLSRNRASLSMAGTPTSMRPLRGTASLDLAGLSPSRQESGVPFLPGQTQSSDKALWMLAAVQQHRSALSSQPCAMGKQGYATLFGMKQLLLWCVTPSVAAAVGTVAYAVLLVVLVLALLWAWITRTVFSVYCIFFPCAADTPCCLKLTRTGDFWSMSDIMEAFKAVNN